MLISNTALLNTDLQRNYMWDVLLPDIQDSNGTGYQGEDVSPFIQSITFGQYTMDDVSPIRHGSLKTHVAGLLSIQTATLEFLVDTDAVFFQYFEAWRSLIYDSTNLCYFPKSNYASYQINVNFYDTQGNGAYQWTLNNVFPKTFPNFKLSYENNEVMKVPIEFSVDFLTTNNNPDV
jgi:hypothetical protein